MRDTLSVASIYGLQSSPSKSCACVEPEGPGRGLTVEGDDPQDAVVVELDGGVAGQVGAPDLGEQCPAVSAPRPGELQAGGAVQVAGADQRGEFADVMGERLDAGERDDRVVVGEV